MTVLVRDQVAIPDEAEAKLLIREARRRQRRRRLTAIAIGVTVLAGCLALLGVAPTRQSQSLLARALHFPPLGRGGRCPVSSGHRVENQFFAGPVLGSGPVRVLLGDGGDIVHGQVDLPPAARGAPGWSGVQTLWFAMPSYSGPFVVRGARLGAKGQIEVQSGGTGGDAGQVPGSGPLVIGAGPTLNTFYTGWRRGHVRDAITGRLVPTLTGFGYRTVPNGTWINSPGCYGLQVDGRGFSEVIVINAT